MNFEERNKKIAEIIGQYSAKEMIGRQWLDDCYADNNRFRNAFCTIKKTIGDVDLTWWYIAYGQSFGKLTDPMHEKMADLCKSADKEIITFRKDIPLECQYRSLKDSIMGQIFALDFNKPIADIRNEIYKIFRSEKFYHQNRWCTPSSYAKCEHREKCPIHAWISTLSQVKMPLVFEKNGINSRAFFYFDSLLLIRNPYCSSFNDFFFQNRYCFI